jgi:serine/threonine protein phosphatase PrpC
LSLDFFRRRRRQAAPPSDETDGATPAPPASFEHSARTHVGVVRTLNEDRLLARPEAGLWAVADGMGGHDAGDLAAQAVIDRLAAAVPERESIRSAIGEANEQLRDRARASGGRVSGATIVILQLRGSEYRCYWAGDSEAWLMRGSELRKLTRDHSLVEELVQAGVVAERDRHRHPQAHVITRAVGVGDDTALDEVSGGFAPGDLFLLCSDGLTGAIGAEGLRSIDPTAPLEAEADRMLGDALARGAADNVSLVLVRVPAS